LTRYSSPEIVSLFLSKGFRVNEYSFSDPRDVLHFAKILRIYDLSYWQRVNALFFPPVEGTFIEDIDPVETIRAYSGFYDKIEKGVPLDERESFKDVAKYILEFSVNTMAVSRIRFEFFDPNELVKAYSKKLNLKTIDEEMLISLIKWELYNNTDFSLWALTRAVKKAKRNYIDSMRLVLNSTKPKKNDMESRMIKDGIKRRLILVSNKLDQVIKSGSAYMMAMGVDKAWGFLEELHEDAIELHNQVVVI
jgi:hypothetical protein